MPHSLSHNFSFVLQSCLCCWCLPAEMLMDEKQLCTKLKVTERASEQSNSRMTNKSTTAWGGGYDIMWSLAQLRMDCCMSSEIRNKHLSRSSLGWQVFDIWTGVNVTKLSELRGEAGSQVWRHIGGWRVDSSSGMLPGWWMLLWNLHYVLHGMD